MGNPHLIQTRISSVGGNNYLVVDLVEDDRYQFYRCCINNENNIDVILNDDGQWRDRLNTNHKLAELIGSVIESKTL